MNKKASVFLKAVICIVSLLIFAVAAYFGSYFAAVHCAQNGKPDTAEQLLVLPGVTALHDPFLADYIQASRYTQEGDHSKAVNLFYELSESDYLDSNDRMVEAFFQQACDALDSGDYRLASLLFAEADELGHDDAEDMLEETTFLWAEDLIEKGELIDAYKKLNEIRFYSNADTLRDELTHMIYEEGVALYRASDHSSALERFSLISSYEDSNKYELLCYAHLGYASGYVDASRLKDMFYFEDTAQILLKYGSLAYDYLYGAWISADGLRCIYIYEDTHYLEGLPETKYCYIIDGIWYTSDKDYLTTFTVDRASDSVMEAVFKLRLVAPDILEVYCYANDATYMLYRQLPWQVIDDTRA